VNSGKCKSPIFTVDWVFKLEPRCEQDRQTYYNVTLRRVHATNVAVDKQ
jgi:hypothetical protein